MPLLRNVCLIFGVNLLLFAVYSEQAARPASREAGRVQFNEVAAASGITFRHENGASADLGLTTTGMANVTDAQAAINEVTALDLERLIGRAQLSELVGPLGGLALAW